MNELLGLLTALAQWGPLMILVGAGPFLLLRLWDRLTVRVVSALNDDGTVEELFERLLEAAKTSMIIHDDGHNTDGSVYNSDNIVATMRARLQANPDLRIQMFFNVDEPLKIKDLEPEFPGRVTIRCGHGRVREPDIHYKIIDGGLQGHLSRHGELSDERRYRFIDCSAARRGIRQRAFGRYCSQFRQDFGSLEAAA